MILGRKEQKDSETSNRIYPGGCDAKPVADSRDFEGRDRGCAVWLLADLLRAGARMGPASGAGLSRLGQLYDYDKHVVYRHEQTFPKHKSDRLALFKATRAYCEQIYMLYSDPAFTAERLIFGERSGEAKAPELEITDEYGVVHRVWKLVEPEPDQASRRCDGGQVVDHRGRASSL